MFALVDVAQPGPAAADGAVRAFRSTTLYERVSHAEE